MSVPGRVLADAFKTSASARETFRQGWPGGDPENRKKLPPETAKLVHQCRPGRGVDRPTATGFGDMTRGNRVFSAPAAAGCKRIRTPSPGPAPSAVDKAQSRVSCDAPIRCREIPDPRDCRQRVDRHRRPQRARGVHQPQAGDGRSRCSPPSRPPCRPRRRPQADRRGLTVASTRTEPAARPWSAPSTASPWSSSSEGRCAASGRAGRRRAGVTLDELARRPNDPSARAELYQRLLRSIWRRCSCRSWPCRSAWRPSGAAGARAWRSPA